MKITEQWLTERNACERGVDWYTAQNANDSDEILNKLTSLRYTVHVRCCRFLRSIARIAVHV
jgi:hypothetical protein